MTTRTTSRPDPAEVLSLVEAAALAGLVPKTLYVSYRMGRLAGTPRERAARPEMRSGGDYIEVTRGALHEYLVNRSGGRRKPLPPDYIYPRGYYWPGHEEGSTS